MKLCRVKLFLVLVYHVLLPYKTVHWICSQAMAFDLLDIQNDVYKYEANEGQMKEVAEKLLIKDTHAEETLFSTNTHFHKHYIFFCLIRNICSR